MRIRSVLPLGVAAVTLVVWLSVRMWFGSDPRVWMISCLLGAWAPLGAASFFLYVRSIADREDRVLVAWLVRALGMHCVLVWMLGFSDWMAGPPGQVPHWNSDIGAPIALLGFAPTLAASYFALRWLVGLSQRLAIPVMRPAMPTERHGEVVPFRGAFLTSAGAPITRTPIAPFVIAAAAFGSVFALRGTPYWLIPTSAAALAICTARNHRALAPSVATLAALALTILGSRSAADWHASVSLGVAWPWLSFVALGFFLVTLEGLVRARRTLLAAS